MNTPMKAGEVTMKELGRPVLLEIQDGPSKTRYLRGRLDEIRAGYTEQGNVLLAIVKTPKSDAGASIFLKEEDVLWIGEEGE